MSYRGRLVMLSFILIMSIVLMTMHFKQFGKLEPHHLLAVLVFLTFAWWAGGLHDKSQWLAKRLLEAKESNRYKESKLQSLFEHNPDAIYEMDLEGKILTGNPGVKNMLGVALEELPDRSFVPRVHPDDLERAMRHFRLAAAGEPQSYEIRIVTHMGAAIPALVINFPIYADGKITGVYGVAKDMTEQKRVEEELVRTKETLEHILNNQLGMTFTFEKIGEKFIHTMAAGKLLEKLGLDETAIGQDLYYIMDPDEAAAKIPYYEKAWNGEEVTYVGQIKKRPTKYLASLKPVIKEGRVVEVIASCIDITERVELERKLTEMAYRDALTGLYNRRKFDDSLKRLLESARPTALLLLDVDKFKQVNDRLGHDAGDQYLKEIARLLEAEASESDLLFRMGGDEFALLRPGASATDTERLVGRIRQVMDRTATIAGREVPIAVSIGASAYPEHGADAGSLFRHADAAMYREKQERREL